MSDSWLTPFWIMSPIPHAPLGFGVTAYSLDDALQIIHALGYGRFLPDDPRSINAMTGVTVAELDEQHVVTNMGPINVRGMWYPFLAVGIPSWAAERLK